MLKICKVFWAFKAITLLAGFMIALSALMGLLMGLVGSLMSMMTTWAKEKYLAWHKKYLAFDYTWAVSPTFSRTQMNLSDSIVRELNPMLVALMPTLVS